MEMARVRQFAGVALIAMAAAIIVNVVLSGAAGDMSADRDQIRTTLKDIQDNRGLWLSATSFDIIANALTVVVAAALFVILQDGTQLRRTLGLAGFIAGGTIFVTQDLSNLLLARLAADAAAGVNIDIVAEQARAVALASELQFAGGFTFIAFGFVGFNLLIVRLPATAGQLPLAIPRWIGWLGLIVGVDMWLSWLQTASSDLMVVTLPALLGSLVWMVALAVVLLRAREASSTLAAEVPSPA